jgi:hypothetical protein
MGGNAQRAMMMKTDSAAPVAMLKADFLLEFEIGGARSLSNRSLAR